MTSDEIIQLLKEEEANLSPLEKFSRDIKQIDGERLLELKMAYENNLKLKEEHLKVATHCTEKNIWFDDNHRQYYNIDKAHRNLEEAKFYLNKVNEQILKLSVMPKNHTTNNLNIEDNSINITANNGDVNIKAGDGNENGNGGDVNIRAGDNINIQDSVLSQTAIKSKLEIANEKEVIAPITSKSPIFWKIIIPLAIGIILLLIKHFFFK